MARVGPSGAPALWVELQRAALDEGTIRPTLGPTRLHLGARYSITVIGPRQGGGVGAEPLHQTHHPDFVT